MHFTKKLKVFNFLNLLQVKKELQARNSPLFESSKMLNISFGIPKDFEIGTFKKLMAQVKLKDLKVFLKFRENL